jgi:hypothetical protein
MTARRRQRWLTGFATDEGHGFTMKTYPYQQAFDRIRAEFLEMPGMTLTPEQVRRLCGVDINVCEGVLNDLVRARFLTSTTDGSYRRITHFSRQRD